MKIYKLMTNHLTTPLGFATDILNLSWITECEGKKQTAAQVVISTDSDFSNIVHNSGKSEHISSLGYCPSVELLPRTRYYWKVTVWADNGESSTSETTWFETGKKNEAMEGKWIAADLDSNISPLIRKSFEAKDVVAARLYICGLGCYEAYINGIKISEDLLAPGHHSYDLWLQTFAYDITDYLSSTNYLGILLTNGWYKGRFGFDGGFTDIYGDTLKVACEIRLTMADGSEQVIPSDATWESKPSPVTDSGIYLGEDFDQRLFDKNWCKEEGSGWTGVVETDTDLGELHDRYSPSVKVIETKPAIQLIHTPKDEYVLDFGQNMTGWVEFDLKSAENGQQITLSYSEIMQDDCYYRDNLRTAECRHVYISDGKPAHVRPHGSYFGFRYVKIDGIVPDPADFIACCIHSDIEQTGFIETDNPKLNRLFLNALWGQKSNFLDVPTDCPQRDERMGWTGDAQIFAGTACFNMHTPAFYAKYMEDLLREQSVLDGGIPFVIPVIKPKTPSDRGNANMLNQSHSSCAWGDVACVLPWTLYEYYGDKAMLERHYPAMKGWVEYIKSQDEADGGKRLWQTGFHFADWLALDNYAEPFSPIGGTDSYYIASAYYYYSTTLAAKAADVLGYTVDYIELSKLANEIKAAFVKEYFTPNGRCAINTQTARVVALKFGLVPDEMRTRQLNDLKDLLTIKADPMAPGFDPNAKPQISLKTGFVGTPYLCPALSENGDSADAYSLLLKEDYPSWLYEVNMGATTIWERWNSVLPDGHIGDTGMNSLNHYSYGSIVEWMYRYACGLNQDAPGFKKVVFRPLPDPENRLGKISMKYKSASGTYQAGYEYINGKYIYHLTVPFDCEAKVILPDGRNMVVGSGVYSF